MRRFIGYDYRFPELYREYEHAGVDLVLHLPRRQRAGGAVAAIGDVIGPAHRRHNATAATSTYPAITMPAAMTAAEASNHIRISCANSSAREPSGPRCFVVRADGITVGRLRRNRSGVLVTRVDTDQALYDSTVDWRDRAIDGVLHSGTLVDDPRSSDRTLP